jgi:hypothetical protein
VGSRRHLAFPERVAAATGMATFFDATASKKFEVIFDERPYLLSSSSSRSLRRVLAAHAHVPEASQFDSHWRAIIVVEIEILESCG